MWDRRTLEQEEDLPLTFLAGIRSQEEAKMVSCLECMKRFSQIVLIITNISVAVSNPNLSVTVGSVYCSRSLVLVGCPN